MEREVSAEKFSVVSRGEGFAPWWPPIQILGSAAYLGGDILIVFNNIVGWDIVGSTGY